MSPEERDDLAATMVAALMTLPPSQQMPAMHELVSIALHSLPLQAVRDIKADILAQNFDLSIPVVATTLDLIDGHIALREMEVLP